VSANQKLTQSRRTADHNTVPRHREKGTTMSFLKTIQRFLNSEDGPTAVEYAVMLALIVIVCLTAIKAVGTNANAKFEDVRDNLT
jgi:pilus assembly protein Flp/PilA